MGDSIRPLASRYHATALYLCLIVVLTGGGVLVGRFGSALMLAGFGVLFAGAVCWSVTLLRRVESQRCAAGTECEALLVRERAARGEAETANCMKEEFLSVVSHELRTPLNAILGWSQILNVDTPPADLAEGLSIIERNGRAQRQIIDDLLDMGRIISGKLKIETRPTDLAAVIDAAVDSMRPAADAKGVRITQVLDIQGVIIADPDRLQQVIWNLLSNAIKFTPRGGSVEINLTRGRNHIELHVTDSGDGIEADFLPFVFDRFRQADASITRRHGGLGLGLSIVKQLVELHGGSVRAASDGFGQGCTFTVALPISAVRLASSVPIEDGERSAMAIRPAEDRRLAGIKILVVDDEPDARTLVKRVLENCGAAVYTAGSAEEAIMLLGMQRPDVLISDIGMPGDDGYALMRRVRLLGRAHGGNIHAIALTSYARPEDRRRALQAGFQTHVAKPVEPTELITLVASLGQRAAG